MRPQPFGMLFMFMLSPYYYKCEFPIYYAVADRVQMSLYGAVNHASAV